MLKNNNYLESMIADYVRLKLVELKSAVLDPSASPSERKRRRIHNALSPF